MCIGLFEIVNNSYKYVLKQQDPLCPNMALFLLICIAIIFVFYRCMHHGVRIAEDWNRFGLMLLNTCTHRPYEWEKWIALDLPV